MDAAKHQDKLRHASNVLVYLKATVDAVYMTYKIRIGTTEYSNRLVLLIHVVSIILV